MAVYTGNSRCQVPAEQVCGGVVHGESQGEVDSFGIVLGLGWRWILLVRMGQAYRYAEVLACFESAWGVDEEV